ncbi:MAG: D-2-hydroxyacid dehydrogenase [Pseudomonadota bacterium]
MKFNHGVFLDFRSLDQGDLNPEPLRELCQRFSSFDETPPKLIAGRIADADVAITNKVVIDAAVMQRCTKLRLICIAATGTNNVDLDAAERLGIRVANVTGYATPSVVQHVFAGLLTLVTRLDRQRRLASDGSWEASRQFCVLPGSFGELAGMTLGIIGYGELGGAVARAASCFGMQVKIAARPGGKVVDGRVPLPELLASCDVVTLHCPLADNTRNLIDAAALAQMQKHAILINCARGGIVDESALADALIQRRLGGAFVDVLTTEPPVGGNPLLDERIPNLVLTPHTAWASAAARQRLIDGIAANMQDFLSEMR